MPEVDGGAELTVEAWIKHSVSGGRIILSAMDQSVATQWLVTSDPSGSELRIMIADDPTYSFCCGGLWPAGQTAGANLQDGQWYHIAFVYNGGGATNDDRLRIYVNGERQILGFVGWIPATLTDTHPPVRAGGNPTIGASYLTGFYAGNIDDVKIYDKALAEAEIVAHSARLTPAPNGPLAYWRMEEQSGGTAADASGHDQTLLLAPGAAQPAWSPQAPAAVPDNLSSLSFNGTSSYAYSADLRGLQGSQFTFSAWIKMGAPQTNRTIASAFRQNLATQWLLTTDGTGDEIMLTIPAEAAANVCCDPSMLSPSGATTGQDLQPGYWYHIAFVYDGTGPTNSDRLRFYINGQGPTYVIWSGTIPAALQFVHPAIQIGGDGSLTSASLPGYFQGTYRRGENLRSGVDQCRDCGRSGGSAWTVRPSADANAHTDADAGRASAGASGLLAAQRRIGCYRCRCLGEWTCFEPWPFSDGAGVDDERSAVGSEHGRACF